MNKNLIERRELLQWMALSGPALAYLAGCGSVPGGKPITSLSGTGPAAITSPPADELFSTDGSSAPPANYKTLVTFYDYSGTSLVPTESDLRAALYNVTPTDDRFDDGKLCYEFNGTNSMATMQGIADFPAPIFAISFWAKSSNSAPMQAVGIAAGTSVLASIEFNNVCGLGVRWGVFDTYVISSGIPGQFTDALWHHILVQFDGTNLSAFVDGIAHGSGAAVALTGATNLFIGGTSAPPWNGALDNVRLYNRSFDADYVPHMVYAWTQIKPANRNDSLLAYYPFNGNAVNDNGRGFNGTLYGVIPAADRYGTPNCAYAFDGTNSYIELPQGLGPVQGNFCLAFWIESSSSMAAMTAFSVTEGITPQSGNLNFVFNSGYGLSVTLDGVSSTAISYGSAGDLTDGQWHFILLQRVGITFQLYVDGVEKGTMQNTSAVLTSDSVIRFGRASGTTTNSQDFWLGSLDDVQIYGFSGAPYFNQQEILDLMHLQFRPRDGAGLVVFQDKMWLLGGWNPADVVPTNDEVWSSSDGSTWAFVCNAPWEGRHMAGWQVYNDRLWILGGDNNSGQYQNDVWSSADGLNWVEETASVPWANRATQITAVYDNLMWYMGGQQLGSATDPGSAYNDVYSSADGKNWTKVTAHAGWSPRGLMIGDVVFNGRMWVIGGGTYDIRTYLNDVWSSADGANWTMVQLHAAWAGRQYHNVVVFDGKLWVIAGATAGDGGTAEVWYSSDGIVWTNLSDTPWGERHAASACVFQNAIWFGCGSDSAAYNDVWKLAYAT